MAEVLSFLLGCVCATLLVFVLLVAAFAVTVVLALFWDAAAMWWER